jgi:hypothetical protein
MFLIGFLIGVIVNDFLTIDKEIKYLLEKK